MASDLSFVEYLCEHADLAGRLTFRKMFGEFALYLEGRVVALVCDNQLFLKDTAAGRALLDHAQEGQPYPGARPHLRISDEIDDRLLLQRLLRETALALPLPKPKVKVKVKKKAPAAARTARGR